MNQIQGAIRYVKYLKEENNTPSIAIKLCTIEDALEKQIEQSVKMVNDFDGSCPVCKSLLIMGKSKYNYCSKCGQKLSWD